MERHRFDAIAKSAARSPSRRQLVGLFGAGGLAALAMRRESPAGAQTTSCTLKVLGTVRVGPSATQPITDGGQPGVFQGQLAFAADQHGAIAQGQIALTGGPTVPVVGEITGRTINLRMQVNNQLVIVAVGTAAQDLTTCQGSVDGLLTGPQPGDLGDWHATASPGGTNSTPMPANASTGGQTTGAVMATTVVMTPTSPQPTATTSGTTTTEPTSTAPPVATIAGCAGAADGTACGSGLVCCDGACVDTQSDVGNCGSCHGGCLVPLEMTATCVNGQCVFSCGSGRTMCGQHCVDTGSDPYNCGGCGTQCQTGQSCAAGLCVCPGSLTLCSNGCEDLTSDANNCGSCGNACPSGQICFGGACATDHR